jgi:tetratricopeptide (TPR) repeat protein
MARLQLKAAMEMHNSTSADDEGAEPDGAQLQSEELLNIQIARHADRVEKQPGYADVHYRYGVLLRAEGRLPEALEQFEKAVSINSTYTQAVIKKGITLQDLGQTDQAIETLTRALELAPEYVDLHYRLGLLYTDGKRFEEAIKHLETADEYAGNNEQIRATLALALQNMGLMDRAAATWRSLSQMHEAARTPKA